MARQPHLEWATLRNCIFRGGNRRKLYKIADVAAVTLTAEHSGLVMVVPDVTSTITITLPTPALGLELEFMYGGVAADAQNHVWTGGTGNFLRGGILNCDADAGAGADEIVPTFGNGSSHITLTLTTPANYMLTFKSDASVWYVNGWALSATIAAFS